jgi:hypothetical protein
MPNSSAAEITVMASQVVSIIEHAGLMSATTDAHTPRVSATGGVDCSEDPLDLVRDVPPRPAVELGRGHSDGDG